MRTRRDSHASPKYFMLGLTSLTDWVVKMGAVDTLGVLSVTSMWFSVQGV